MEVKYLRKTFLFALFLLLIENFASAAPRPNSLIGELKKGHEQIERALKNKTTAKSAAATYFFKYGYLQDFDDSEDPNIFADSLKSFQKFAGLLQTGKLDDATKKQFTIPRCGMSDPISKLSRRKRRYLLQGQSWDLSKHPGRILTWRLENTGRNLQKENVRRELTKAFGIWQKHANIYFKEISSGTADIMVKFANACHGDPYCFDFRGGTLAHAFYPYAGVAISGDVHFDNDENFVIQSPSGTDLLWVAVHEIGHSLGLEHSNVQGAIMYPWYQGYKGDFDLTNDDQAGIQALYGAAVVPVATTLPVTTAPPTTTPVPTTTAEPTTTQAPTTTAEPTTVPVTTAEPTTVPVTTAEPTTVPVTTAEPTTVPVTTAEPTTIQVTTAEPTTVPVTTAEPTTVPVTTAEPTTEAVTPKPTEPATEKPTTQAPEPTAEITDAPKPEPTAATKKTTLPFHMRPSCPKYLDATYISMRYKWMIIVSGHYLYLANRNGFRHGPLIKRNYFPRIRGTIDSTMTNTDNGRTIIFSGKSFYVYREFMHLGGPYPLTNLGFSKDIQKVDASLKWKRNGQYYVFSNDLYWRFNPKIPGVMKNGYPKKIKDHWRGVPDYLSTAVTDFDGITRFTKGEQYYTLIDRAVKVDSSYPGRIGDKWMQCRVKKPVPKDKVKAYTGPLVAEP